MRRKKEIELNLVELADKLNAGIEGEEASDPVVLSGISTLAEAGPDDIAFIADVKYLDKAAESRAGAFLVSEETKVPERPCLVVDHVWKAALKCFDIWYPDERMAPGVHPSAVVDAEAQIAPTAAIGPLVVIEAGAKIGDGVQVMAQCFIGRDALIGDNCLLHPGVKVLERVRLGTNVILHSGAVLGADGYGYEIIDGCGVKIPQVGTVVIEDDVEIGANTCVDRAFLTETRIGMSSKIDNLVQIAHNCKIGKMCGMAAQVGIAGSVTIGDGCMFWGQSAVRDNITIGNRVTILGRSAPGEDVPDGETMFGAPAYPISQGARIQAAQAKLPDMMKRLRKLEKMVEKSK
ncbi:MAG: UDP-3-O-(3-hydroxymyristoyl)glucosamine N-acyltransferase [Candidatus Sumerlaeia bacterium]